MPDDSQKQEKAQDQHLALISIILGATSFFMGFFTGIPAIVVGIIALRRNSGDRLQAKLGILFGVLSTLFLVFIFWLLGFHLFNSPIKQQFSVNQDDYKQMSAAINGLKTYKKIHGAYPKCQDSDSQLSCADWRQFTSESPGLINKPVVFVGSATAVPSQPVGTMVYVNPAVCLVNTPTLPAYLRDHNDPTSGPSDDNIALVYFHDKGRACYSTSQSYSS